MSDVKQGIMLYNIRQKKRLKQALLCNLVRPSVLPTVIFIFILPWRIALMGAEFGLITETGKILNWVWFQSHLAPEIEINNYLPQFTEIFGSFWFQHNIMMLLKIYVLSTLWQHSLRLQVKTTSINC